MQVRADTRDKNSIELSHNKTDISSVIDHTRSDDINSEELLFNYTSANGHFGDNKTIRGAANRKRDIINSRPRKDTSASEKLSARRISLVEIRGP